MYIVKVEVRDSEIDGKGVFTLQDISKGDVVWKFDLSHDQVMSPEAFSKLSENEKEKLLRVAYLSRRTKQWVYPPAGDAAEFTNHSKENNLSVMYNPDISEEPIFFANRNISSGEELTNNYNDFDDLTERDTKPEWL